MIVAIHQPNFIPWTAYFNKISRSDVFVFMDNAQYTRGSWINRVKIKTSQGSLWLTVPVRTRGVSKQKIVESKIVNQQKWAAKMLKTLEINYRKAPYFTEWYPLIENILCQTWELLADLNIELIKTICVVLKINPKFVRGSELECGGRATDLLVNMVKAVGGNTYLYGKGIYQENERFLQNNLTLLPQNFVHPTYQQLYGDFVKGLSILDALFNVGSEGVRQLFQT